MKSIFFRFFITIAVIFSQVALAYAGHLEDFAARVELLVGTTGDYRTMSYYNAENGEFEGIDA